MATVTKEGRIGIEGHSDCLLWAAISRSKLDDQPCGDGYLVRTMKSSILVAMSDGTGSGKRAMAATTACLRALARSNSSALEALFGEAHDACKGTGGAALAIALIDTGASILRWASVGDIEGVLLPGFASGADSREVIVQRGGTLGYFLPPIIAQEHELHVGDVILMTSDGISRAYRDAVRSAAVGDLVRTIMESYSRRHDDALVFAARFGGDP